jgi:hypothetical protein
VATLAGDTALQSVNKSLRDACQKGVPLRSDLANLAGVLQERLSDRVAI